MKGKTVSSVLVLTLAVMFALAFVPLPSSFGGGVLASTVVVYPQGMAANPSAELSVLIPAQQPASPDLQGQPQQYMFASAAVTSGSNYYWVGAESFATSALSNQGVRGTIQVVSTQVVGCLSFWVAEEMASNTVWGQVGYYICNGATPVAFYQIWTNGAVTVTGTTVVTTGSHQFGMYRTSGNMWAYTLDGATFGTYNMGSTTSSSSYPVEALSEEGYVSSYWNPPQVAFSQVQVLQSGAWSSVSTAFEPYACGSTSYSCWGVQGNKQNSTLPTDAIVVGGSTPTIPSGTTLWSGSVTTTSSTTSSSISSTTTSSSSSTSASTTLTSVTSSVTSSSLSSSSTIVSSTPSSSTSTLAAVLQATLTITPTSAKEKSTVYLTVLVTDQNGNPVGGASVSLTITKPNGRMVVVSSTTNSAGQAYFQYKVSAAGPIGTYSVSGVASLIAYTPATVSGKFTVS